MTAVLFLSGWLCSHGFAQPLDFGDAPEGSPAYLAPLVPGSFPTCINVPIAPWIQHTNFGAFFGPSVDFEPEGNAGLCPGFAPYDADECFADGDAGLIVPSAYTITLPPSVVPCPNVMLPNALGLTCQTAAWGPNVDIIVRNFMPGGTVGFVNVLMDWDQNGVWGGTSSCPLGPAPEHVLVNFPVPNGFPPGPLSALQPPPFLIGPNAGYVWTRFSITELPVPLGWDGSGSFEDGESEDYLLRIDPDMQPTMVPQPTECPVEQTRCPIAPTSCPVVETECPTGDTWCPVIPTECPQEQTHCPVVDTACPVIDTQCPAQGPTICPETSTQCPVVETLCPLAETFCPVSDTFCPQQVTFCPLAPTQCPNQPTFCPPQPTVCDVTMCTPFPTFCPPLVTNCPFVLTTCPVIDTACPSQPSTPTVCPEIATECPIIPTVCQTPSPTVCPVDPTYCPLTDSDSDGVLDCNDNCVLTPNGPLLGTCVKTNGSPPNTVVVGVGATLTSCTSDSACSAGAFCQLSQGDCNGDGCGDACECYADIDNDGKVQLSDLVIMKSQFSKPCPCTADLNGDGKVDLTDLVIMKTQFLRTGCPC